jgi:hypothetical protein
MKPQFTKEQLDEFWNAADSSRGDKSHFRADIFQLIEALNDSYENEAELKSKVEEMQKTLEFYGTADNWELPSFGQGHSAVVSDRGERARQALKGITNGI